jgi:hypothetical protein
MALPQHITLDEGGTVSINLIAQPTTITVEVEMGDGTDVSSGSGVASTIDTTLTAAVGKGATVLPLTSVTGVSNGATLWIQDVPENVRVKSVNALAVSIFGKVINDHANASPVQGCTCSYAISASEASSVWWDGRVKWTIDGIVHFTAVECTKYPLTRHAGLSDLRAENPKIHDMLDAEEDVEETLDLAHESVLSKIGARARARVFPGSTEFTRAVVLTWWEAFWRRLEGDSAQNMLNRYERESAEEIARVAATAPRDENQDGVVSAEERFSMATVPISRG